MTKEIDNIAIFFIISVSQFVSHIKLHFYHSYQYFSPKIF